MPRRFAAIALLALLAAAPCRAADDAYTVVRVDVASEDLRLAWRDDAGQPLRRFARLADWTRAHGRQLVFAMNAGMYEADASPVGLLVVDGVQRAPLNLADGAGNFFLKPNGVFALTDAGPRIVGAAAYAAIAKGVRFATQSGPLLLEDGRVHPAFKPGSTSRLIRNGVCVSGTTVLFVISNRPVNFHEFAVFFRDGLHCRDALYLDGVVSSLYSASLGRDDERADLGPMFAVLR